MPSCTNSGPGVIFSSRRSLGSHLSSPAPRRDRSYCPLVTSAPPRFPIGSAPRREQTKFGAVRQPCQPLPERSPWERPPRGLSLWAWVRPAQARKVLPLRYRAPGLWLRSSGSGLFRARRITQLHGLIRSGRHLRRSSAVISGVRRICGIRAIISSSFCLSFVFAPNRYLPRSECSVRPGIPVRFVGVLRLQSDRPACSLRRRAAECPPHFSSARLPAATNPPRLIVLATWEISTLTCSVTSSVAMHVRRQLDIDAGIDELKLRADQRADAYRSDTRLEAARCVGIFVADLQGDLLAVRGAHLRRLHHLGAGIRHHGLQQRARQSGREIGGRW